MENRYVLIADILGFSNIVKNLDDWELDLRINKWIGLIENISKEFEIKDYQLLSDTLFVSLKQDINQGENLFRFSKKLLEETLKNNIPIRGAISYGRVHWGKMIYGKPIIDAHSLEINQDWIGICLEQKFSFSPKISEEKIVICYTPPIMNSVVATYRVINWDIPEVLKLIPATHAEGLVKDKEAISWSNYRKLENTNTFRKYLEKTRKLRQDPKFPPLAYLPPLFNNI
ncbi:MAG: hypothetical protein ACHQK8_04490 [Bacteroidia bacterium]